jgi:DNA mismatch endonuclease (patch repair protein)
MADIVSREVRSRMMSGIRGKNTKPELLLRRLLHRNGFRYRLHAVNMPGRPDLVFPKYRAVLFAHGCFWHGHGCHLFRLPTTRSKFWSEKIANNRKRDAIVKQLLRKDGWRILTVWECAIKGRTRLTPDQISSRCSKWLRSESLSSQVEGRRRR